MAKRAVIIALAFAFILALIGPARCDTPNVLCNMSRDGLQSCLPSVRGGATYAPPPTPTCCAAISKANITCLCSFKGSKLLSFYGINTDLALDLPHKCNVEPNQCPN